MPAPRPRTSDRPSGTAIVVVVCLALATVVAAMSSLNVALPSLARGTHANQTQLEWVIDAYSLAFASLLLPGGAIGDRFGRRLALLVGLALFGGGSAVAMTASSPTELIALRALLGVGAALVMPATLSTITTSVPAGERPKAIAVWAAVAGGAAILGLLVAGALLTTFSWTSVFGLNVVLAAIAIVGTLRFVPESAASVEGRLDVPGAAIAVAGLVLVVFSVIEAPDQGWTSARTVIGLLGGVAVLAGFIVWELRTDHPLLDPRVFRDRRLSAGSSSVFIQFFAFFGFTFCALQFLQGVRGDTPLLASVSVLPLAATMMPVTRLAPKLVERIGARAVNVAGLAVMGAGFLVLSRLSQTSPYLLMAGGLVLLGAGMGLAMTPATTAITAALPASQQGVGSALNDLSRELGGALGIAVIGSVLQATYRSHLHLAGLPDGLVHQAKASFAIALHLGSRTVTTQARAAFSSGVHSSMLTSSAAALFAAVLIGVMLGGTRTTRAATVTAVAENAT